MPYGLNRPIVCIHIISNFVDHMLLCGALHTFYNIFASLDEHKSLYRTAPVAHPPLCKYHPGPHQEHEHLFIEANRWKTMDLNLISSERPLKAEIFSGIFNKPLPFRRLGLPAKAKAGSRACAAGRSRNWVRSAVVWPALTK